MFSNVLSNFSNMLLNTLKHATWRLCVSKLLKFGILIVGLLSSLKTESTTYNVSQHRSEPFAASLSAQANLAEAIKFSSQANLAEAIKSSSPLLPKRCVERPDGQEEGGVREGNTTNVRIPNFNVCLNYVQQIVCFQLLSKISENVLKCSMI